MAIGTGFLQINLCLRLEQTDLKNVVGGCASTSIQRSERSHESPDPLQAPALFRFYCAGAQLQATFPVSVVVDGVGLNMTVMSYRDHLDFGVICDKDQIPDAWPFMDHLGESLDELKTVVRRRRAARSGRAARA